MKIAFSYAGHVGGLGLGYIAGKAAFASARSGALHRLFACRFEDSIAHMVGEAVKIEPFNEFEFGRGILARAMARFGLTYYLYDAVYDHRLESRVGPCDIFHAFTCQSPRSMIRAGKLNAKVIADSPNTHPMNIRRILTEEYKIWKVPLPAYNRVMMNKRMRAIDIADRILVLSQPSLKSFINAGCPPRKISVVPYGVDAELFKPRPQKDNIFRVLFIGQICLRKGFQYLLEAWSRLKLKNAELVLAGPVKPDAACALRKYEGKVAFRMDGPLYDMGEIARLYNDSTVAVFPSVEEGFGMVVTEAMASGLPVIVSENVGAKDLIRHREEGFVVPIRDPASIKEAITELYEDEAMRKRMGQKARIRAESQTWEAYQDNLVEAYKELA